MSRGESGGGDVRLFRWLLVLSWGISDVLATVNDRLWPDEADSSCSPGDNCRGDQSQIPFKRGLCFGPVSGCSGGQCICKDVCMTGLDHEPKDYTHPSWDWSKSELVIEMVQGAREGGTNGVENLVCPKTTAVETDAVTCGVNNLVGGDCEFKRNNVIAGVGFCAQNGTSSQIECWDACASSLEVETSISGAPEGTRTKIEYKRNQQCPSWWFTVLKVFGLMILVVLLAVLVMYLCFQAKLRSSRLKKKRALAVEPPLAHGYQHVPTAPPQPQEPSSPPGPPVLARNEARQVSRPATTPMFTTAYSTSNPYTASYAGPTTQSRASANGYSGGFATYQPTGYSGFTTQAGPGLATGPMYTAASQPGRIAQY